MINEVRGFTLLELLIALALFALLGVACAGLLHSVLRSERDSAAYVREMRGLQRALAVIERDLLQARSAAGRAAVVLDGNLLNLQRGNWLNPLEQPRSDWQEVSFTLQEGSLWRYSQGDRQSAERQLLLAQVATLGWRVLGQDEVWHARWPVARSRPLAVELTLSSPLVSDIRRVFLLPGAPQ